MFYLTLEQLKKYNSLKLQKEALKKEIDDIESISSIDTTKPSIMSGNADCTADKALRIAEMEEYNRVCKECRAIQSYLLNITDQEVKSIAYAYIVDGESFKAIGKKLHYNEKTISRKLNNYIVRNVC